MCLLYSLQRSAAPSRLHDQVAVRGPFLRVLYTLRTYSDLSVSICKINPRG